MEWRHAGLWVRRRENLRHYVFLSFWRHDFTSRRLSMGWSSNCVCSYIVVPTILLFTSDALTCMIAYKKNKKTNAFFQGWLSLLMISNYCTEQNSLTGHTISRIYTVEIPARKKQLSFILIKWIKCQDELKNLNTILSEKKYRVRPSKEMRQLIMSVKLAAGWQFNRQLSDGGELHAPQEKVNRQLATGCFFFRLLYNLFDCKLKLASGRRFVQFSFIMQSSASCQLTIPFFFFFKYSIKIRFVNQMTVVGCQFTFWRLTVCKDCLISEKKDWITR